MVHQLTTHKNKIYYQQKIIKMIKNKIISKILMINRNLICGKLMSVKKLVKHALLIESHKLKYMNHLLAISCLKNKNNNGKKLKKYVIKYQIKIINKLGQLDNGNKFPNKTTLTSTKQLINNNHNPSTNPHRFQVNPFQATNKNRIKSPPKNCNKPT